MQILTFLNGDTMPILGLGTWKLSPVEAYEVIRESIRLGYRHFDCAHMYGNEEEIGVALADAIVEKDVTREDLWITSKLWNDSHDKNDVVPALQKTLSHLKLEYLDLYLVHWPIAFNSEIGASAHKSVYASSAQFPLADTWTAMEACVAQNLTRHIGVANFSQKKIEALKETASLMPEMNQVELHPFLAQNSLVEYCHNNHIHITAYAPLGAKGRASTFQQSDENDLFRNPVIKDICLRRGMAPAQVLIKWSIERGTSVIPKSSHPERLRQNIESIYFTLGANDIEAISNLDRHLRFVDAGTWVHAGSPHTFESIWDE